MNIFYILGKMNMLYSIYVLIYFFKQIKTNYFVMSICCFRNDDIFFRFFNSYYFIVNTLITIAYQFRSILCRYYFSIIRFCIYCTAYPQKRYY